jgi:predicted acyltransferase
MSELNSEIQKPVTPRVSNRLKSLDVFRGFTMVGMILVDNQGNFDYVYPPVNGTHKTIFKLLTQTPETTWNGLSSADFVFPFFLFIAGVSAALAMKNVNIKDKLSK